jgi:recombination DNA repair RAD52 pathway protein
VWVAGVGVFRNDMGDHETVLTAHTGVSSAAWTDDQVQQIQDLLDQRINLDHIRTKPAGGGREAAYAAANTIVDIANSIFGFNGWSSHVLGLVMNYVRVCVPPTPQEEMSAQGRYSCGYTAHVRVTVRVSRISQGGPSSRTAASMRTLALATRRTCRSATRPSRRRSRCARGCL